MWWLLVVVSGADLAGSTTTIEPLSTPAAAANESLTASTPVAAAVTHNPATEATVAISITILFYLLLVAISVVTHLFTTEAMYDYPATGGKFGDREKWYGVKDRYMRGDLRRELKLVEDLKKGKAGKADENRRRKLIKDEQARMRKYESGSRWRHLKETDVILSNIGPCLRGLLNICDSTEKDLKQIYKDRYEEGGTEYRAERAAAASVYTSSWAIHRKALDARVVEPSAPSERASGRGAKSSGKSGGKSVEKTAKSAEKAGKSVEKALVTKPEKAVETGKSKSGRLETPPASAVVKEAEK